MVKIKLYDTDGTIRDAECELLAVCGFTRPSVVLYRFQTDFVASRGETFTCLAHLSAQLQAVIHRTYAFDIPENVKKTAASKAPRPFSGGEPWLLRTEKGDL